jgi:hypothetical protein
MGVKLGAHGGQQQALPALDTLYELEVDQQFTVSYAVHEERAGGSGAEVGAKHERMSRGVAAGGDNRAAAREADESLASLLELMPPK